MKRYEVVMGRYNGLPYIETNEREDGKFVLFVEAQAEIDRLKAENAELLVTLEEMASQHFCGCKHPACKNCERDAMCGAAIAKARGEP